MPHEQSTPTHGYIYESNVANYANNNAEPNAGLKGARGYYIRGALSPTLWIGASGQRWRGRVKEVVLLSSGGTAGDKVVLYDSDDAAALTNKRHIEIHLQDTSGEESGGCIPVDFGFVEGLVIEMQDAGGTAAALIKADNVEPLRS